MQNSQQQIVHHLQNKQFQQAINLCKVLLEQSNHPQLHLFLAIAYGEIGEIQQAIEIFENLRAHFPKNADIFYNYGLILQNNNYSDQAIKQYQTCIRLQPNNLSAWNNLGEIHRTNNHYSDAITAFSQCLKSQPNNLSYLRNLGITFYQDKQFDKAQPLLLNIMHSKQFIIDDCLAILDILITLRQLRLATDIGTMAIEKFNNEAEILNLIGLNELEKRKFYPAIQYLKKSVALKPGFMSAMCHLASAYLFAGDKKQCHQLLKQITSFETEAAFVFVATMYETSNQSDLAATATNQGLELFPNNSELLLIKAKFLRKDKQYKTSLRRIESALRNINDTNLKASIYYEKGLVLDKLAKYGLAWENYHQANKFSLENWHRFNKNTDPFIRTCKSMVDSFDNIHLTSNQNKVNTAGRNLIFIVGFPRSGTTLLDSILSAHSDVTVLEEAPIIGETYDQIKDINPNNYANKLLSISTSELDSLRKFYFNSIKNYSNWDQQGVLVDKSPLNTMHVGFIHQLFPSAKILFSQRHPLDVCISCFFQNFKMNSFMTNMTSIDDTAKTYGAMLNVWQKSVSQLNIDVHYQSYEKLVSDFESQTKALFKHLGLSWQKQVLSYQKTLQNRGAISTPSYDQVNQPIYQSAKNRYKNYLPHLKNATQILSPWISKFNYQI